MIRTVQNRSTAWACSVVLGLAGLGCGDTRATPTANNVAESDQTSGGEFSKNPVLPAVVWTNPKAEQVSDKCVLPRDEVCNGRDDDCDRRVDEDCGYESGRVQVVVGWDTGADVDLYVTDPNFQTVSFQSAAIPDGATLDHAGRGNCSPDLANARVENVRWERTRVPLGDIVCTRTIGENAEVTEGPHARMCRS